MASAILYVSFFLLTFLASTSIAQNQQNNAQGGGGLLENKLKPLNNQQYNEFDWKLSKALNAKEDGNFVVSPLSVKLALSMLYLGTQGPAAKEIEEAFAINSTLKETVEQRFSSIMRSLESKEEAYELNIGTKIFADLGTLINSEFARKIKDYYNSSVHLLDFRNKPLTMSEINDWCNKITKGKIFQLVDEGDFNDDTVMMLLNAIYFRGEWKLPFARNETKPQMFSISRNRAVNVHMMSLTEKFGYYDMKEVKSHLIRLPYVGDKFAMYILYPYEVDGLANLAKEIKPDILAKSLSQRSEKTINLRLPKFKFESTAELVDILKMLNIKELFTEKGYLEGIGSSPKGPLVVSNILQKSGIEVNEKGSTAYATTNVVVDSRFGAETPIDINITHPFIFLIADEAQNNIIFIGKVIEPLPANVHHHVPSVPVSPPQGYQPSEQAVNQAGYNPNQVLPADIIEKLNYFDKELLIKTYHQATPKENIVLSPASVKVMLALLLEGAAGQSEKELKDALRLPEDKHQALAVLQQQLAAIRNVNSPVKVDTQNKVFLASDEKLSKRYYEVLSKNYGAEFQNVNFLKQDEAVNTINSWVNEVTRGVITSLVTKEDLDAGTRLLLANCIYFKGEWKTAFDQKSTYTNYFYTPEPEIKTKYMTAEIPIKFHEDSTLDAKIAEIPFKDERYTFTIVLPNRRDGIEKLLRDLPHNSLLKLFSETKDTIVKVTLPKTTIQFKTPLADILSLRDIDIKDVFTSKANLTGILENNKPIYVKDIFHNAKIELTEEGAKAAAASGSNIVLLSASFSPEFKADHPFVYFIRDTHDSGFLFEGILYSPDVSSDPVQYLPVDNRNGFDSRPSSVPTTPIPRTTTRRAGSPQRPNGSAQQPQPPTNRPNGNGQQPLANRNTGTNQPASQQSPTPRPIIGYQNPRPQEKGSVEYPILQENN